MIISIIIIIIIIIIAIIIIIITIIIFTVHSGHFITARRPDMIFIDKKNHECQIIDFDIPYDTRVDDKEVEKIEKYLDLARELKKVWNMKVMVVPLVVGALDTPAKELE